MTSSVMEEALPLQPMTSQYNIGGEEVDWICKTMQGLKVLRIN